MADALKRLRQGASAVQVVQHPLDGPAIRSCRRFALEHSQRRHHSQSGARELAELIVEMSPLVELSGRDVQRHEIRRTECWRNGRPESWEMADWNNGTLE